MGKVIMSGIVPKLTEPSNFPRIGTALNDMTWEEIRAISDAGLAGDYFSAGDIKTIIINGKVGQYTFTNLSIDVFIIGIDHNSEREGTNKIHFQIGKINGNSVALVDSKYLDDVTGTGHFVMNTSNSNYGGWASCHMRKTILGSDSTPDSPTANTLLAALPSDLRAVMKPMTKYSDNTGGGSNTANYVTATTDYLPLLAEFEVFGSRSYANSAEQSYQKQYDYYAAGNGKAKFQHNAMTSYANWWMRSSSINTGEGFCNVAVSMTSVVDNSYASSGYSKFSEGVSPTFAV